MSFRGKRTQVTALVEGKPLVFEAIAWAGTLSDTPSSTFVAATGFRLPSHRERSATEEGDVQRAISRCTESFRIYS